jgi:hypothetical protein
VNGCEGDKNGFVLRRGREEGDDERRGVDILRRFENSLP